jgi:hypothetical protein
VATLTVVLAVATRGGAGRLREAVLLAMSARGHGAVFAIEEVVEPMPVPECREVPEGIRQADQAPGCVRALRPIGGHT